MATVAQLKLRILRKADMEINANVAAENRYVQDDELLDGINTAYKDLYGRLVRAGLHKAESTGTITPDGSTAYALPADFYAMMGVWRVSGGASTWLSRHDHRQRPIENWTGYAVSYRVIGLTLELLPTPAAGSSETYTYRYIPIPGDAADDADTIDGVLGWEEYIVLEGAIALKQKSGEPGLAELERQRDRLLARIEEEADAQEMSETTVIQNSRADRMLLPGSYGVRIRPRDSY